MLVQITSFLGGIASNSAYKTIAVVPSIVFLSMALLDPEIGILPPWESLFIMIHVAYLVLYGLEGVERFFGRHFFPRKNPIVYRSGVGLLALLLLAAFALIIVAIVVGILFPYDAVLDGMILITSMFDIVANILGLVAVSLVLTGIIYAPASPEISSRLVASYCRQGRSVRSSWWYRSRQAPETIS